MRVNAPERGDGCARDILDSVAKEEKPRIFQGGMDMLLSLGVILIMMFAVVGVTGLCTINPEVKDNPAIKRVDARPFLELEARSTSAPLRMPQEPEGWMANMARRSNLGGSPAAVIGWVTDSDTFIHVAQTTLEYDKAVSGFDPHYREPGPKVPVANTEMEFFSGQSKDVKDFWAADLGDIRVLVSGTASEDDTKKIITALSEARPLPTEATAAN